MRLQGKVALISGAAQGMGVAHARLLAKEGARVAITDILEDEGLRLEEEIAGTGGEAVFHRLDVTRESEWKTVVEAVVAKFGKLDVLVNNAGTYDRAPVGETTVENWDRVMDVNAKGVFLGTKTAIPAMKAAGGGSIVNVSSVSGLVGSSGSSAYTASKGAVRLLTKSTAIQYAKDGIRANSVHPGPIDTAMLYVSFPNAESQARRRAEVPLGRFGTLDEVAYGVLFLASDESSYVTGSELVIDGGATAR